MPEKSFKDICMVNPKPKKPNIFGTKKNMWALIALFIGVLGYAVLSYFKYPGAGLLVSFPLVLISVLLVLNLKKPTFLKRAYWTRSNLFSVTLSIVVLGGILISFYYLKSEAENKHPYLSLTNTESQSAFDPSTGRISVRVDTFWTNTGETPAYNTYMVGVAAPLNELQNVKVLTETGVDKTIDVNESVVISMMFSVTMIEGKDEYAPNTSVAFYYDLRYYGSQEDYSVKFHNDQWSVVSGYSLLLLPEYSRDIFEISVKKILDQGN
jgi:hypothetical protein